MSLENEVAELVKASNALTTVVAQESQNNTDAVNQAIARTDQAIANVNAAIPTAVKKEMYQQLYLDPVNGSDSNSGANAENSFQTLKALIDSVPVGGTVCVRSNGDLVIDVNDAINAVNKHIIIYSSTCTLNLNATITLQGGSFKNYYTFQQINQTVAYGFRHYSADIRIEVAELNPSADAEALFKQSYTAGAVSQPGSHHSNMLFQGTVSDAVAQYYVFEPTYYKSSMIVTTYNLTLGANVGLFDPVYSTVQVGSKGVYLVGA